MKKGLVAAAATMLILWGCSDAPTEAPATAGGIYLEAALDILEANSLHRYEVDWEGLRSTVWRAAGDLPTPADAYPAIRHALTLIGEQHSFLLTPDQVTERENCVNADPFVRVAQNVSDTATPVGYVRVGTVICPGADALATAYQRKIEAVDTTGVCGWIVDLRNNGGGNMSPMIGGVGPIVGEGVLGYFIGPDETQPWSYQDGTMFINGQASATVREPYVLRDPEAPVAVLVNRITASAAEATFLSFFGRPNTLTIGGSTAGYSTGNKAFRLSDGAVLAVTTVVMADRNSQHYNGGRIAPEKVAGGDGTLDPETDYAYRVALEWLAERAACAAP